MKKITYCLVIVLLFQQFIFAQETPVPDTSKLLNEVVITAFEQSRIISNGTIVKVLNSQQADRYNKTSLVNAFNTLAGVRMEERSPGSYRINLRGSSLRSPFGVRNVKTYWNDIPMTDAGGNTYFNQFAYNNFSTIEIIKGPTGSLYGAGTGGTILMHSFQKEWTPGLKMDYVTGSYGLQNLLSSVYLGTTNNRILISYAHNQNDGYRDYTNSKKDNISFVNQVTISEKQQITASFLYTNLYYQTPGGINIKEFNSNPRQSRPAVGVLPSSADAKATIYQQDITAGVNHQYQITTHLKNSTTVYANINQIKNPAVRNYERRSEPGYGGRTSFIYEQQVRNTKYQFVTGMELQYGNFNTKVSKNKNGEPDTLQTDDEIQYKTSSIFAQADISLKDSWIFTAGVSTNKSKVNFTRVNEYPVVQQGRTYKNELSPRLSVQKIFNNKVTVFASVAKGFSPPTISELLPSTSVISTNLEAEQGTNYELGARLSLIKGKLWIDATGYFFRLNNALVSRKDSSNADYFINAGNTRQQGIEMSADYSTAFYSTVLKSLIVRSAWTLNDFSYGNLEKGKTDFSGNALPGVPKNTISITADLRFKQNLYMSVSYLYQTKTYLDDANTATANAFHLLGCRAGWKPELKNKIGLDFYFGIDNLLNEIYSLGNDINAAAGRYYNVAPNRNYYAGVSLQWNRKKEK